MKRIILLDIALQNKNQIWRVENTDYYCCELIKDNFEHCKNVYHERDIYINEKDRLLIYLYFDELAEFILKYV